MDCWYQQGCNLYFEGCEKTCHRFLEMRHLISNCGMPNADKYIKPLSPEKVDLKAFERLRQLKDNILSFVKNGNNLYIVSEKLSNGKTTWALKLLYKYFDEIWCGNGFQIRGYFLYVPEFLNNLRMTDYKSSLEYKNLIKVINSADLVVWDDIAVSTLNLIDQNNLVPLLESRILKDKSNIFTGNILPKGLQEVLGLRLSFRLSNSIVVEFKGKGLY